VNDRNSAEGIEPTLAAMALGVLGALNAQAKFQSFAEALQGKDPVTAVNQFCQRFSARPISAADITYTDVVIPGEGHQCTVTLHCLDDVEFGGHVKPTVKEAKNSAAQQVLDMYANELANMPAKAESSKNKKKRAADGLGLPAAKRIPGDPGMPSVATSHKGELNQAYSKIVRRVINKSEITYTTLEVQGGFQSQVALPGLPPPWNNEVWAGEVMARKADAEQSVAQVALQTIMNDPTIMALHSKPPKPNQWVANGGLQRQREKGKGKGKEFNKGFPQQPNPTAQLNAQLAQAMATAYPGFSTQGFSTAGFSTAGFSMGSGIGI